MEFLKCVNTLNWTHQISSNMPSVNHNYLSRVGIGDIAQSQSLIAFFPGSNSLLNNCELMIILSHLKAGTTLVV